MTFSERIQWNPADLYILHLAGFPIAELYRCDYGFSIAQSDLYAHVCSFTTELKPGQDDFVEILLPHAKLEDLHRQIDSLFPEALPDGRQTLWTIVARYLWDDSYKAFCDNLHERRFDDPELGNLFRALDDGIKRGMFGTNPLDENLG